MKEIDEIHEAHERFVFSIIIILVLLYYYYYIIIIITIIIIIRTLSLFVSASDLWCVQACRAEDFGPRVSNFAGSMLMTMPGYARKESTFED